MEWERGIEACRSARVYSDGLDADTDERRFFGEPAGTLHVEAGGLRGTGACVQEKVLVVGASIPAGAQEQPAAVGERAVLGLESADIVHGEQVVRVFLGFGGFVDDDGGSNEVVRRDFGDVDAVTAGYSVDRGVEVGADVLPDLQPVLGPGGTTVIVGADLVLRQTRRVDERLWEL